jgi:hypothetical protein
LCIATAQWEQPEADILDHLDKGTPEAEHDCRTELRVIEQPDDDFVASSAHLFHHDAFHIGLRGAPPDRADHSMICCLQLTWGLQVHGNTANIDLVHDVVGGDLETTGYPILAACRRASASVVARMLLDAEPVVRKPDCGHGCLLLLMMHASL